MRSVKGQAWALTPIDGFSIPSDLKKFLKDNYIRYGEELSALLLIPSAKKLLIGNWRSESGSLESTVFRFSGMLNKRVLEGLSPLTQEELDVCGIGLLEPDDLEKRPRISRFVALKTLGRSSVNHIDKIRPFEYGQGRRGTCVAFGTTILHEFLWGRKTKLSEQFLYWGCKQRDGRKDQSGTRISFAIQVLREQGQCTADNWKYNPSPGNTEHQGPPPSGAEDEAARRIVQEGLELNSQDVNQLRDVLLGSDERPGRVISFGVPVFNSWYMNALVYRTGRIGMPLPNESHFGGHCMCLVGYEDDPDSPGGGFFILRNSWQGWGAESSYGMGYGTIPYAYLALHGWEAWLATLADDEQPPKDGDKPVSPKPDNTIKPLLGGPKGPIIIGRSAGDQDRYGSQGLLTIGHFHPDDPSASRYGGFPVALDVCFPHVIYVCGKRSGGKSYTLGVILEEMAQTRLGLATVVIDPMSVFYTLKEPNDDKNEKRALRVLGLEPRGYDNIRILAPRGVYLHKRKPFMDAEFSIRIADLTADDWCNVFGISEERFGQQGLLLDSAIKQVCEGYKAADGSSVAGQEKYSLGELLDCISVSEKILSPSAGFTQPTRRSISNRLEQAAAWGIFTVDGTPLEDILRKNALTVLDTAGLDTSSMALVVGILSRRILQSLLSDLDTGKARRWPNTWLVMDEAHLFVPNSGTTPASTALTDYVKRGRRAGCGLVFATQRPAATHSDVVSQLDILIGHNLAQADDIKALLSRIPSNIPKFLAKPDRIRALRIGSAIIGDQNMPERAFLCRIRPRTSAHAGKSPEPSDAKS